MSTIQKRIFTTITQVKNYLTSIGFTITNGKILWRAAEADTQCYLQINNDIITFRRSDGESAFTKNLVDFNYEETIDEETITRDRCAVIYIPLVDNGFILYLGMIKPETDLSEITICCSNANATLNNGLIVCSPPEGDGHWYYGWNQPNTDDTIFQWCLDNGHGNYEYGAEVNQVPQKKVIESFANIVLVRSYLNTGYWSKNFRVQVAGNLQIPAYIFKANGQRYIVITSNTAYRAPAYKLSPEAIEMNLSTSTEEYSNMKTYAIGDYCIYNGLLWRCIVTISTPEPFDQSHWQLTTVHNEMMEQQNHIYGN